MGEKPVLLTRVEHQGKKGEEGHQGRRISQGQPSKTGGKGVWGPF